MSKVSKPIRSAVVNEQTYRDAGTQKTIQVRGVVGPRYLSKAVLIWGMLITALSPQFLNAQDMQAKPGVVADSQSANLNKAVEQKASQTGDEKSVDTKIEAGEDREGSTFNLFEVVPKFFAQLNKNQSTADKTTNRKPTERLKSIDLVIPRSSYQPRRDYRAQGRVGEAARRDMNRFQRQLQRRLAPRGVQF